MILKPKNTLSMITALQYSFKKCILGMQQVLRRATHPRFLNEVQTEAVNMSTEVMGPTTQLCLSPSFV